MPPTSDLLDDLDKPLVSQESAELVQALIGAAVLLDLQPIQRAFRARAALAEHVSVDQGGPNIIVARQLLDRADGHPDRALGPHRLHRLQRLMQHLALQEQQRVERLILGRGGHFAVYGQIA